QVRREDAERVARLEGARLDGGEVVGALRAARSRELHLGPLRGDPRRRLVELEAVAVDEVEVLLRGLSERLLGLGRVLRADLAHARAELLLDALQPLERRLVPPLVVLGTGEQQRDGERLPARLRAARLRAARLRSVRCGRAVAGGGEEGGGDQRE